MNPHTPEDLQRIYQTRFEPNLEYRQAVWRVLIEGFFSRFVGRSDAVLDLGCGYGEFINQVKCGERFAMDLNPAAAERLQPAVKLFSQDCSDTWPLDDGSLDVVFTSNFFEHLPNKAALGRTLDEVSRCLRPGGRLIALGPNIKHLPGLYWEFWDHHLPLTETSLSEALETRDFEVRVQLSKFLPYTMANKRQVPLAFVRWYLKAPLAWRLLGKQFLVIAAREWSGRERFSQLDVLRVAAPSRNLAFQRRF